MSKQAWCGLLILLLDLIMIIDAVSVYPDDESDGIKLILFELILEGYVLYRGWK